MTDSKIRFEGVLRTVKEEANPPYGMVLKVTIIGDDGNTYWCKTNAKAFWTLHFDDRLVIEAAVKCRKPSTYTEGTEFVVVTRPKLIENKGQDEATRLRREQAVYEAEIARRNAALRDRLELEGNGLGDILEAQLRATRERLEKIEEARKAAAVGESNQEPPEQMCMGIIN